MWVWVWLSLVLAVDGVGLLVNDDDDDDDGVRANAARWVGELPSGMDQMRVGGVMANPDGVGMSAFPRGGARQLYLRMHPPSAPRCYSVISQRHSAVRIFSSRTTLYKATKKTAAREAPAKKSIKRSAFKAPAPLPVTPPPKTYQSFASVLASRASPTLLYQAPSHTTYIIGSYAFGIFCLAYAGYNFNAQYLHAPPGLAAWVPVAFGGVCFAMACVGSWLVLGPSR